jgi:hypothetical protein
MHLNKLLGLHSCSARSGRSCPFPGPDILAETRIITLCATHALCKQYTSRLRAGCNGTAARCAPSDCEQEASRRKL